MLIYPGHELPQRSVTARKLTLFLRVLFVKELNASRIISHIQIKDVGMAVSVCVQLGNRITVTQE
jgi:hypothetical protein